MTLLLLDECLVAAERSEAAMGESVSFVPLRLLVRGERLVAAEGRDGSSVPLW
jgi:hypothetical protein